MTTNMDAYYSLFNDFDSFRVAQFDAIMESDIDVEVKAKLTKWYSQAKASIPNLGDKSAKSLAFSILRMSFWTEPEEKTAQAIGWMVNAAAPKEWRAK